MQCRPVVQNRRVKRLQCFIIEGFCSKISPGWSLEKIGRPVLICMYVCLSIFDSGARTVGRIGTGEYSFDVTERRKDDGNSFRLIGCTWHVPRAIAQTLAKEKLAIGAGQTNGRILLKLGGTIGTIVGLNLSEKPTVSPPPHAREEYEY